MQPHEEQLADKRIHKTLKGLNIKARGKGGTTATPGKKIHRIFHCCLKCGGCD